MKQMLRKNIAVILAAGVGARAGYGTAKQMMKLAGKPLVEHTIEIFQTNKHITEILIVTNELCVDAIEQIVLTRGFSKVRSVILGGKERYESSLAAIRATAPGPDEDINLIFHDAVRPLVSDRIITEVVEALGHHGAVDVVVPTTDTIVVRDPTTNTISSIPERAKLRNGQTPQGFRWEVIDKAYALAIGDSKLVATDDCGIIMRYTPEQPVYLVDGDTRNIKLTYEEDLAVIDKLLQLKSRRLTELDSDSTRLASLRGKRIVVFGGTSGIGEEIVNIAKKFQAQVIAAGTRTGIDIGNLQSVESVLTDAANELGGIDCVINTAAVLTKKPLTLMEDNEVAEVVGVNYMGAINVARAAFKHLEKSKGHLLNFTSSSYTYGRANYSLYSSTKAAVVNLTQALGEEWHPFDIKVNCVNPERTHTPMRTRAFGLEEMGTLLQAAEVARVALAVTLANTTGQVYDVRKKK